MNKTKVRKELSHPNKKVIKKPYNKNLKKKRKPNFLLITLILFLILGYKAVFSQIKNITYNFNNYIGKNNGKQKEIMNSFRYLCSTSIDEKNLIKFIDENVDTLSKDNASEIILKLEEIQNSHLEGLRDDFSEDKFQESLKKHSIGGISKSNLKNIKDTKLNSYLQNLYETGYKINLNSTNNTYNVSIDYDFFNKYTIYLNLSTKDYFKLIKDKETFNYNLRTSSKTNWDSLRNMALSCDEYLNNYNKSLRLNAVKEIYCTYIKYYTLGNRDFSPFDSNNILKEEVKKSYEGLNMHYNTSNLNSIINGYLYVLNGNNFSLNNQAEDYILDKTREILQ